MTRLVTCGFEQQLSTPVGAVRNRVEGQGINGTWVVETSIAHSGTASAKITAGKYYSIRPTQTTETTELVGLANNRTYYSKIYVRIATAPSAQHEFFYSIGSTVATQPGFCSIDLKTDRTLQVYKGATATADKGTTTGSASPALALDTWYRLEVAVFVPTTGAGTVTARLDGVDFVTAGATASTTAANWWQEGWGDPSNTSTAVMLYLDDHAINDDQGSSENTYSGPEKIILLKPISDNSITGWTDGDGSGTLFGSLDNIPPVGVATPADGTQIKDSANNATDNADVNLQTYTTGSITSSDTIKVVQSVAQVANSTTTSRNVSVRCLSNPADAGDTNVPTGTVAIGSTSAGWWTGRGDCVHAPSVTLGTSPVVRLGKRTATTDTVQVDFAGLLVGFNPFTAKTATADAIVQSQGVTKTLTADAIVQTQNVTKTVTTDAIIQQAGVKTFTADASVLAQTTKIFTADAVVVSIKTFTTDVLVVTQVTKTYTADAIVSLVGSTKTVTVDAVITDRSVVVKTISGQVTYDNTSITVAKWSTDPTTAQINLGTTVIGGESQLPTSATSLTFAYRTVRDLTFSGSRTTIYPGALQLEDAAVFDVDIHVVSSSHASALLAIDFFHTSTHYYRLFVPNTAGATSTLYKTIDGSTFTSVGTIAKGIAVGTTKHLQYSRVGSTFNITIDGVSMTEYVDGSALADAFNIRVGAYTNGISGSDIRLRNANVSWDKGIDLFDVPVGGGAKLFDSAGSVMATAVEASGAPAGQALLNTAATPLPLDGYIQFYTDGALTVPATHGRYPPTASTLIRGGDQYHYNLTAYQVMMTDAAGLYSTSQINSHNGVVFNGDDSIGLTIGPDLRLLSFKANAVLNTIQTHEVGPPLTLSDSHSTFNLHAETVTSPGRLHGLYGGYAFGEDIIHIQSNSAFGWDDWAPLTTISGFYGEVGTAFVSAIDQDDTMYIVGSSGNDIKFVKRPAGGSWSSPVTLVQGGVDWAAYVCDIEVGKEVSGQKSINVTYFMVKTNFSEYRNTYLLRTTDGGTTWKGIQASAYTLPLVQNNTTGVVAGCEVIYSGTSAYIANITADSNGNLHVAQYVLSDTAGNIRYYKGTSAAGWVYGTTHSGFIAGAAIVEVVGQIVFLGTSLGPTAATPTAPTSLIRYTSPNAESVPAASVTWTSKTTMLQDDNAGYPPIWVWLKPIPIIGTVFVRALWHARYTGYKHDVQTNSAGGFTGEGTASLFLKDIQAVGDALFTVNAIVKVPNVTKTVTVDAIVQSSAVIKTFTADAIVDALGTKTFTVDAIVSLITSTLTFTTDAIVTSTTTPTVARGSRRTPPGRRYRC